MEFSGAEGDFITLFDFLKIEFPKVRLLFDAVKFEWMDVKRKARGTFRNLVQARHMVPVRVGEGDPHDLPSLAFNLFPKGGHSDLSIDEEARPSLVSDYINEVSASPAQLELADRGPRAKPWGILSLPEIRSLDALHHIRLTILPDFG